jgi:hypothetical protein
MTEKTERKEPLDVLFLSAFSVLSVLSAPTRDSTGHRD